MGTKQRLQAAKKPAGQQIQGTQKKEKEKMKKKRWNTRDWRAERKKIGLLCA